MKQLRIIVRILLGAVFIFSGFVKGVDPTGSAIKFSEYFEVFHLSWLDQVALILAVILSTAEFIIGVSLVIGLRIKVTAWAALSFMVVFTLLTLYSAIYSPVSDCGCFGDALILTNWQTFYKNIILLFFAVFVFWQKNNYLSYSNPLSEWGIVIIFTVAITGISVYCIRHLPIIDFRPYHVGSHIPSKMTIPEGAPTDVFDTKLYYSKNGIVKEFTLDNFPSDDSTWKYVDTKNTILKKGYKPPIHDFSISGEDGSDVTDRVLTDPGYSFLAISYDVEKMQTGSWDKISKIAQSAKENGHSFYFLTGSSFTTANELKLKYKGDYSFYSTDVTALKTIIRANPGLLLLKDGVVLAMWHVNDIPDAASLKGNLLSTVLTSKSKMLESKRISILLSALAFALVVIWFFRKEE